MENKRIKFLVNSQWPATWEIWEISHVKHLKDVLLKSVSTDALVIPSDWIVEAENLLWFLDSSPSFSPTASIGCYGIIVLLICGPEDSGERQSFLKSQIYIANSLNSMITIIAGMDCLKKLLCILKFSFRCSESHR